MSKRLIKRTTAPPIIPLPPRNEPEPETYKCVGPETHITEAEKIPLLGMCTECGTSAAFSWVTKLCYRCGMLKNGFVFDPDTKVYIKGKRK